MLSQRSHNIKQILKEKKNELIKGHLISNNDF